MAPGVVETFVGLPLMAASCLNLMITDLAEACPSSQFLSPVGCRRDHPSDPLYFAWCSVCSLASLAMVYVTLTSFGEIPASSLSCLCCVCLFCGPLVYNTKVSAGRRMM